MIEEDENGEWEEERWPEEAPGDVEEVTPEVALNSVVGLSNPKTK